MLIFLYIPLFQDPSLFKSKKTGRGPLEKGWDTCCDVIMCSYKLVDVSFQVFGLQTKVEEFVHRVSCGDTGKPSFEDIREKQSAHIMSVLILVIRLDIWGLRLGIQTRCCSCCHVVALGHRLA